MVQNPFKSISIMMFIEIPGYIERATVLANGRHIISILTKLNQWVHKGNTCTRRQFPLTLVFTITIHKSQGLTLNKAIVNLDTKHINPTLTYVALSRVRYITNLAIEAIPNYGRYPKDQSLNVKMRINDSDRRRGLPPTFTFRDSIGERSRLRAVVENEVDHGLRLVAEDLETAMNILTVESLTERS